jgi:hypothetical protein
MVQLKQQRQKRNQRDGDEDSDSGKRLSRREDVSGSNNNKKKRMDKKEASDGSAGEASESESHLKRILIKEQKNFSAYKRVKVDKGVTNSQKSVSTSNKGAGQGNASEGNDNSGEGKGNSDKGQWRSTKSESKVLEKVNSMVACLPFLDFHFFFRILYTFVLGQITFNEWIKLIIQAKSRRKELLWSGIIEQKSSGLLNRNSIDFCGVGLILKLRPKLLGTRFVFLNLKVVLVLKSWKYGIKQPCLTISGIYLHKPGLFGLLGWKWTGLGGRVFGKFLTPKFVLGVGRNSLSWEI